MKEKICSLHCARGENRYPPPIETDAHGNYQSHSPSVTEMKERSGVRTGVLTILLLELPPCFKDHLLPPPLQHLLPCIFVTGPSGGWRFLLLLFPFRIDLGLEVISRNEIWRRGLR